VDPDFESLSKDASAVYLLRVKIEPSNTKATDFYISGFFVRVIADARPGR